MGHSLQDDRAVRSWGWSPDRMKKYQDDRMLNRMQNGIRGKLTGRHEKKYQDDMKTDA